MAAECVKIFEIKSAINASAGGSLERVYFAKTFYIIFYSSPAGNVKVEVIFNDETFWLPQKRIAQLFGVEVPAISKHLKNIFESGELDEKSVISKMETTAADGKSYLTSFYNLDAVIAVGYRVNSFQATQFRIWATRTLKEFIIKGFVLDAQSCDPSRGRAIRKVSSGAGQKF